MKIPFFPLQSVFFPGETVPLHIFEERYKQLIHDCQKEAVTFGIPVFIHQNMLYGTEVQLVEVANTYEGGEMDVICVARQVFKILSFEQQMKGKRYAGGNVAFIEMEFEADKMLKEEVFQKVMELYHLMGMSFANTSPQSFTSYSFAHVMGLSFAEEYKLLQITKENDRLLYLKKHLTKAIALLEEINRTKKIKAMNGHFKTFDPLDFKNFKL